MAGKTEQSVHYNDSIHVFPFQTSLFQNEGITDNSRKIIIYRILLTNIDFRSVNTENSGHSIKSLKFRLFKFNRNKV